jgi:DNA-binding MarR family transcriptional regulator
MADAIPAELIEDFLGSTHIFALALGNVMEGKLLREVARGQLTSTQIKVLKLISTADGQRVGDAASFLGVSNPAASKIIERLVARGFLRRTDSSVDRRSSTLSLTPSGRHALADYQGARARRLLHVFRECTAEELKEAAIVLDRLAASLVTQSVNPEDVCLQCEIYFRERCLMQEVVQRNCQYRERRNGHKRRS